MARSGRAGAALATAAVGSFVAGTLATAALTISAPFMVEIALRLGPAEYFSLAVVAFVAVSAMVGESGLHGVASLLFGLLLGIIGIDPLTGASRLTFGIPQLLDGIDVVVVAVGLFAVGEVLYAALRHDGHEEVVASARIAVDDPRRMDTLVETLAARGGDRVPARRVAGRRRRDSNVLVVRRRTAARPRSD